MFFERPEQGSRTLIVHIKNDRSELATLSEIEELARSADLELVGHVDSARREPHPKTFVGQGKLEEVRQAAEMEQAELILFSEDLSPAQERNLDWHHLLGAGAAACRPRPDAAWPLGR